MLSPVPATLHPTVGPVPTHALFVGLGVLAATWVFVHEARRRGLWGDERLLVVVAGALVCGAVLRREGVHQAWRYVAVTGGGHVARRAGGVRGGRSILGGLAGA